MTDNERKKKTALSVVLTLLPALFGAAIWLYADLSGLMAHFHMPFWPLVIAPVVMAALDFVALCFTHMDKGNDGQSEKVMGMIYLLLPVISLITTGAMTAMALGAEEIDLLIAFLIGIMFIFIGNEMPKIKRNGTLGVKIKWTLESDENWHATHRFTGKLWVVGGFLLSCVSFIPVMEVKISLFVSLVVLLALVPVLYSWNFNKKEKREGTLKKKEIEGLKNGKKGMVFSVVVLVLVAALVIAVLFFGNIEFEMTGDRINAKANFYSDISILYSDIESVELVMEKAAGGRTFGYGSPSMNCGSFRSTELGDYTRYTNEGASSYVLVLAKGEKIVFSTGSDEGNRALADTLSEKASLH